MTRALVLISLCASSFGCSHPDASLPDAAQPAVTTAADAGEHQDEPQGHEALPTRVRLPPQVLAAAGIKTGPVVAEALPLTVSLTGELRSDPDRTAEVTARVPGRIVEVHFKEGDRVKRGAPLAIIESPELARARATFTAAAAKAKAAQQNLARLTRVAEKGLASGQEVATATADAQTLEAEQRAARGALTAFGVGATIGEGARLELRAPVSGFVLTRDAILGQTVTPQHVVTTIADLDEAYFIARLFEKDLAHVKAGAAAEVRLNAYPNEVFLGTVATVGRALDPSARTVTARIVLQNRNDLLKVGLFGTALVVVTDAAPRTPRPVVPLSAVTKIAEHDSVFVREPDGDFELHRVTLGRTAGGKAEVVAGLRSGEVVATDGVFTLKSAVLKSTFGEEE